MVTVDIVLATTNPAKQGKLLGLLDGLPLKPRPQVELGPEGEAPIEEGSSHEQNARHKAEFWSRAVGVQAIASDGGLLIPALGERWDSLFTHRFAGEDADDQARLSLLLQMMEPFRGEERRATWVEALAIAKDGRTVAAWQVRGPTGMLLEKQTSGPLVAGFWAFSVWHFPEFGKTYNELDEGELESIGDHWTQLKSLVQDLFHGTLDGTG